MRRIDVVVLPFVLGVRAGLATFAAAVRSAVSRGSSPAAMMTARMRISGFG